jgi:hypothetical protein
MLDLEQFFKNQFCDAYTALLFITLFKSITVFCGLTIFHKIFLTFALWD